MKSVGIVTFHATINYGGVLQAYALQKVLEHLGHAPEIIDYHDHRKDLAKLSLARRLLHLGWHGLAKKVLVGTGRERRTDAFRRSHLRLSQRKFNDAAALHSDPPSYDAYITGSDQVWNPAHNNNDSSYFLTFAPACKKRIAYAASFGVAKLHEKYRPDYSKWLSGIDCLSTRESEGWQMINALTGRDAEVLLDPSLLLDAGQWNRIAVPYRHRKPYILCYYMPGDKAVNRSITEIARRISKSTGWDIVRIGQKEYYRLHVLARSVFDAGPEEFLSLFRNASFVVTNSFHGTAFSINYWKPFLVPINTLLSPEKTLASRITTLLKTTRLEHRLVPVGNELPGGNLLDLDFQTATTVLHRERKKAFRFLKSALEEG